VAGGRDRLTDPIPEVREADFIAFVDQRQDHSLNWDQHPLPRWSTNPQFAARRDARIPKIMPWLLAPGHDMYVWVDAHFALKMSLVAICRRLLGDRAADLALLPHAWRRCVYQEAEAVVRLGLDRSELVDSQLRAYRQSGHPEGWGLFATGMFAVRHLIQSLRLSLNWWDHICRFSSRDQLSLPVALRETGFQEATIDGVSHLDSRYLKRVSEHLIPTHTPTGSPTLADSIGLKASKSP
jgi:hypothetical protein